MSRRRLIAPGLALFAAGGLAFAATQGFDRGVVYYYTPSEAAAARPSDRAVRVGGTVVRGSVRLDERAGVLRFALSDGRTHLAVAARGAPPSLFRPGREALVEGRLDGGVLRSSEIIVKHDENYRPAGGERTDGDYRPAGPGAPLKSAG